jgi:nitric oxide dioxygenase
MTPEQIDLVEETLRAATPVLDELVEHFYKRLFAADPSVEALFQNDPAERVAKFAEELQVLITSIRRLDLFLAEAQALGVRHMTYGVRAAHYRLARNALMEALSETLGPAWTDEAETAWRLAYNLTAEAMMTAATSVWPDPPEPRPAQRGC